MHYKGQNKTYAIKRPDVPFKINNAINERTRLWEKRQLKIRRTEVLHSAQCLNKKGTSSLAHYPVDINLAQTADLNAKIRLGT